MKGNEFIQSFVLLPDPHFSIDNCFLARYGGDEFIIIKEHTDPDDMKQMNERLKCLVQDYNNRSSLPLSYAAGYEVSYRNHYFMINDLIQAADKTCTRTNSTRKCVSQKVNSLLLPSRIL